MSLAPQGPSIEGSLEPAKGRLMKLRLENLPWLLVLASLAVTFTAARRSEPTDSDREFVHVLKIALLDENQLDELRGLPATQRWIELGDTLVLVGGKTLGSDLAGLDSVFSWSSVRCDTESLYLATFDSKLAAGALPTELRLLAGAGRYALVLAASAGAARAHSATGITLRAVPWNRSLVRRVSRSPARRSGAAANSPILEAAIQAVDIDAYTATVTDLVNFGTRYTLNSSFPNITNFLVTQFQTLGYSVTQDSFRISGRTRHNVIAELQGDARPNDIYIVCGHYDSISQSPSSYAPGADDNASGSAAVLELARVLRQYRFDATIRFICFAGEEQGLVGSSAYVSDLASSGQISSIKGVINMDMIAYRNTAAWDVLLEGSSGTSQPLLSLLSSLVPDYTSLTSYISTNPFGSDHMPFINQGINAVLTIEYEDWANPYYHSTSDTVNRLSLPFAADIVRLNAAATATQAGIKGGYALEYGDGLAGSGGQVPHCQGTGSTNLGDDISVTLDQGLGAAPAMIIIGPTSNSLPILGGTLLVDLAGSRILGTSLGGSSGTPGAGTLQLNATVPANPTLSGQSLYFQFALMDPGAAHGWSFSNGLQLLFGI